MTEPEFFLTRLLRQTEKEPGFFSSYFLDNCDENGKPAGLTRAIWIDKAKKVGFSLQEKGIQSGDRVLLALPTSEEFLVVFLALWWIGAIPVPLPEISPFLKKSSFSDRLRHVVKDCSPKAIIVLDFGRELLMGIQELQEVYQTLPIVTWESLWKEDGVGESCANPFSPTSEQVAFIQYTSGSTSAPKGVLVTQKNLSANLQGIGEASAATLKDVFLSWLPLYHDMGLVGSFLWSHYWGIPVYFMMPFSFLSDPASWLSSISQYKATISIAPNFAYNLCSRRLKPEEIPDLDLSCWRLAYNGAEPIDAATLEAFYKKFAPYGFSKKTFFPVYGMAEATLAISFAAPGSEVVVDRVNRRKLIQEKIAVSATDADSVAFVSVGKALPRHTVLIKDPQSEEVLDDRNVGEICFKGPSVTPCYYHEASTTKPRQELRTGDLGYLANDQLFIVDRIKDLIIVGGVNYYPSDIEKELQKIPGLKTGRIAAVEVKNQDTGTGSLVIIAEISAEASLSALKHDISRTLSQTYGLSPMDILLSTERIIPLTSSGKIIRKNCVELYLNSKTA